jgi:hypothetical protein
VSRHQVTDTTSYNETSPLISLRLRIEAHKKSVLTLRRMISFSIDKDSPPPILTPRACLRLVRRCARLCLDQPPAFNMENTCAFRFTHFRPIRTKAASYAYHFENNVLASRYEVARRVSPPGRHLRAVGVAVSFILSSCINGSKFTCIVSMAKKNIGSAASSKPATVFNFPSQNQGSLKS